MCDPHKMDVKEEIAKLSFDNSNPFKVIQQWIKWQLQEMEGIYEAIVRRNNVEQSRSKVSKKITDDKRTAEKMQNGEFTIKGMFTKKDNQPLVA